MTICIIANDGTKLMPTTNIKKVRKLLKSNRAKVICHHPFTVQLLYQTAETNVQPIELGMDAGYQTIGVSIKSAKHEFVSAEYKLLKNETEKIRTRKVLRNERRIRLRYRKKRNKNRKRKNGWLNKSILNKINQHILIIQKYTKYIPITSIFIEMNKFIKIDNLINNQNISKKETIFARDGHKCAICGKSKFEDNIKLITHHIGYKIKDRTNRMKNLITVCNFCHNQFNHERGGKLHDIIPNSKSNKSSVFMNIMNTYIANNKHENTIPNINIINGKETYSKRKRINKSKSHVNDAYCIGNFVPTHKTPTIVYIKKRRNNRILEKFYDAKYIDVRDDAVKTGKVLSSSRTNRSMLRNGENNQRIYRKEKVSAGKRTIRHNRYYFQPHDEVIYDNRKHIIYGTHNKGKSVVIYKDGKQKSIPINKITLVFHASGWYKA